MGFVTWLVDTADGYLASAAETQFAAIAATLGGVIAAAATLVIILVLVNMAYQYRSMDGRSAFELCAKLALITIFALYWVQFNYVASAILIGIDTIAGSLISSIGGPAVGPSGTFAEEFDRILNALSQYLNAVGENLNWMTGALIDALGVLLISLLGCLAAFILVGSRMMIAILLGLAPIMIFLTMFEVMKDYFARWLSTTISFAIFPVFVAGIFATIIGITNALLATLANPENADSIGALLPFFMMILMAKGFILATPLLVRSVSGNIIMPAVNTGVGTAVGVASGAANTRGVQYRRATGNMTGAETVGAGLRQAPGALRDVTTNAGVQLQRISERARRLTSREDPRR